MILHLGLGVAAKAWDLLEDDVGSKVDVHGAEAAEHLDHSSTLDRPW